MIDVPMPRTNETGPHIGALGHDGVDGVPDGGQRVSHGDDPVRRLRHERQHARQHARQQLSER